MARATTVADSFPTFTEAYQAAKAEHAPEVDARPEGHPAHLPDPEPDSEPDSDAEPDPVVDGETELETADTTAAREAVPPTTTVAAEPGTAELLTDTDLAALQTKYGKEPGRLIAELNKAWTQKTQALAADRQAYARVKDYLPVIDGLEADPAATIRDLAAHFGVTLEPARAAAPPAGSTAPPPETVATVVDTELATLRADLGPELEYLADGLAPAITKLVERLTSKSVQAATEPLRAIHEAQIRQTATAETAREMTALGTRHPDWQSHEPAMLALAQTLDPKGLSEAEYLDVLYDTVTARAGVAAWKTEKDTLVAAEVKKTLAKMQAGATSAREPRSTPAARVSTALPDRPTFREAYQAAKAELTS